MRIAIVKNIVAPTTTPLFEHLAARGGCEIFVVYETAMESNRAWTPQVAESYPSVVLDSRTLEGGRWAPGTRVHVPRAPLRDLVRFRPDVVVASGGVWSSPVNNCALLRRRAHGWSFVPWWGEFPDLTRPRQRQLVEPWKRVFVRSGDAWLAYSERARLDAIRLGADPSRTIVALNAPELVPMPQPRRRPAGARRRVLFCGQLVARKGLATLLEATEGLPGIELAVAGDGPLRAEVQRRADRDPSVRYLGHLDRTMLTAAYDAADVLVVPSLYEVWGLVVNEALAHGLPVIASDQVAAADHLITPGVTGEIFPAGDAAALRAAVAKLARWTERDYENCASVARPAAAAASHEHVATALIHAAELAVRQRAQRQ